MKEESVGTAGSPAKTVDVEVEVREPKKVPEDMELEVPEPTKDDNGKDVYLCDSCGSLFAYSYSLLAHKRHKCRAGKGEFKCEMCSKRFNFPSQLQRHMPTHTGEKPYQCVHCPKAFNESSNLKQHMLIHTDQKPFCCDYLDCDKRFRSASNLKVHIRTHTKERPYICEYKGCGKRFVSAGDLKRHFRIHTKERPYVCQYCGKSFIQGPYLNIHIRSHTKEKPYNCSHCGKAFSRTSTLKIHLRLHTGGKTTEKDVKTKSLKCISKCDKTHESTQCGGAQMYSSVTHAKSEPFEFQHGVPSVTPMGDYRLGTSLNHPSDNYSYVQSLMYDYGEREVPCGTLPNGQTVPLTGRNASIVRPRPKRAEGASTPISPEMTQGEKLGMLPPQMMPQLSGPDFYPTSNIRLSPPTQLAPPHFPSPICDVISDIPPTSGDKIPPLVPVPFPPSHTFLHLNEPLYTSHGRREYLQHEIHVPLLTGHIPPPVQVGLLPPPGPIKSVFKRYLGFNREEDSKSRLTSALVNGQGLDYNAIV